MNNINDAISCQEKIQEVIECKFWTHNYETKICYCQTANAPENLGTCITCTRGPRNCPSGSTIPSIDLPSEETDLKEGRILKFFKNKNSSHKTVHPSLDALCCYLKKFHQKK